MTKSDSKTLIFAPKALLDPNGADISELKITTPIGESNFERKFERLEIAEIQLDIVSTVDLTQTTTLLPIGTPLRGVGKF